MSRPLFVMLSLFFFNYAVGQNTSWKEVRIDSFLTVSLPGTVIESDTSLVRNDVGFKIKTFKTNTEFATLAVTVVHTELSINPYQSESEQMKESYEGVKYGFTKRAEDKGFTVDMKDTVVNEVRGFKANLFSDDRKVILNRVNYCFYVNSLNYMIVAVPLNNQVSQSAEYIKQIISSIRFNKKEILAHASNDITTSNSLYDRSTKIGELMAPVLLVAGIVIFFVYKSRNKRKNNYG